MSDVHITREMLAAAEAGDLPWWRVASYGLSHLLASCEECEGEYTAYLDDLEAERLGIDELSPDAIGVIADGSVDRVAHRIFLMDRLVEAQKETALATVERLLVAAPEERPLLLHELAGGKPHAPLVGEELLVRAGDLLPDDPQEAMDLAVLAEVSSLDSILGRLTLADLAMSVLARSLALQAEVFRLRGDLAGAEGFFDRLHEVLARGRVADPLALGEVSVIEAALYRQQGQTEEAEELLRMGHSHYEAAASPRGMIGALVELASVHCQLGRPDEALEAAREALALLPAGSTGRDSAAGALTARVHAALAAAHLDSGSLGPAAAELSRARELAGDDRRLSIQLDRLDVRLATAQGDGDRALMLLADLRDDLSDLAAPDLVRDLALVTVQLADLYASRDDPEAVRRLAWESRSLDAEGSLPEPFVLALRTFRRSITADGVDGATVRRVLRFLERAVYNSLLPFDKTSA